MSNMAPTPGKRRTDEELHEGASKLAYELRMLFNTAVVLNRLNRLWSAQTAPDDWCIHEVPVPAQLTYNAFVHSFLLAVRNVHEFFFPGLGVHPNTMKAKDFVEPAAAWSLDPPVFTTPKHWRFVDPPKEPSMGIDFIKLIHTRLAHLTWDRVSEGKIAWVVENIVLEFIAPTRRFAYLVAPGRLSDDFRSAVSEIEAIAEKLRGRAR